MYCICTIDVLLGYDWSAIPGSLNGGQHCAKWKAVLFSNCYSAEYKKQGPASGLRRNYLAVSSFVLQLRNDGETAGDTPWPASIDRKKKPPGGGYFSICNSLNIGGS